MSLPPVVASVLLAAGTVSIAVAVVHERLMHRHRQPGVTYSQATFRRDGGWRRTDLFTDAGLRLQRRASTFGIAGAALWLLGVAAWTIALATSQG